MDIPEFKPAFIERYGKLTDWEAFKVASLTYTRRALRVNTLKCSIATLKKRLAAKGWKLTPIPWNKEGFWVEHETGRRDIGNNIEHALGYFYVQEGSSMIPPIVLSPKPGDMVLDMCASPGSKASQIAQYLEGRGILVANDYKGDRIAALGINLQRTGVTNAVITLMQGRWFSGMQFDKILVDAPCSGTGTISKSLKTITIWNPNMIRRLAAVQKQLLQTAFDNLKPGGTIVYSTCSNEPEEDEGVISHLVKHNPPASIAEISLPGLKSSPPVTGFEGKEFHPDVAKCLRIWPQDNGTEGFFVAKIVKKEE
ncbi:TPA: RsmB/NOP family class I SAM-dependent RNA methyltransferase [Candidatus Woesearchaeota archaeon]|nr:RsmB/NOP family class I SAM-dependent RNA methyltransferase [Candidatus Woesearchaeota archaeon]